MPYNVMIVDDAAMMRLYIASFIKTLPDFKVVAQIGPAPGPGMGEIGMGQRLGLVGEEEHDVPGFGLLLQQLEPEPGSRDGIGVLPAVQAVTGTSPAEAVFFSALLSCDFEIVTAPWRATSACSRGKVQFGRSVTGALSNASTVSSADVLFVASRPACSPARSPATPALANQCRHRRTLSGVTPKARAICPLVQPFADKITARARSASSRRAEPASSCKATSCSVLAAKRERPVMNSSTLRVVKPRVYDPCHAQGNPA